MKTTLTVLVVLFFGLLFYYREQTYVRDPLATVYRNNVKQDDTRVFINYSNDVLLEQNSPDGDTSRILVQQWDKMPGTPLRLTCIRWTACFTDEEHARIDPLGDSQPAANSPSRRQSKAAYNPNVFMTNREVSFVDPDGTSVRITLR